MAPLTWRVSAVALCLTVIGGQDARFGSLPALAQSRTGSPSELEALKADLEKIKGELGAIREDLKLLRQQLSQGRPQPSQPGSTVASVGIAGNLIMGKKDAPVTMIEFSDYQCPFCKRFFETTLPTLKAEYIETGKVRYVFRDFPLDQIHPHARKAAEAAHCAGDQGKYWEMHDLLFQNQQALQVESLKAHARGLRLNATAFDACLDRAKYAAEVQKDLDDGVAVGVRGTPSFFIGRTRPDSTIQGVFLSGALPTPAFRQAIDNALREN
jgi:protein-disulfide isomerase